MGLFSRKKQRDQPAPPTPGPFDAGRSTSVAAATTLAGAGAFSSSGRSAYGQSERYSTGDDELNSPELALSGADHLRVFRGGRGAASSTLSLPSFGMSRDDVPPRHRQVSAAMMASVDEHEAPRVVDKGKWSRWKLGRGGNKGRQASVSSVADAANLDADGGDSGFVVRSFRTVSRVHEDPVPASAALSTASKPSYASLAHSPTPVDLHDPPTQQESLRSPLDYSSPSSSAYTRHYPRRPSLATLSGGTPSSSSAWDRAPSPTITAEAFRFRSKSSLSLASLADPSAGDEQQRPRFEPQRPASRASRRGSSYSDVGGSVLAPPRPSFAIGQHSNRSTSSMHSRTSSTASLSTCGANGLPSSPASSQPDGATAGGGRPSMSNSTSLFSISSYTTAPQPPSASSTPGPPTRIASPAGPTPSASSGTLAQRPALHRLSSGDSELRLIASYGDMFTASPPIASPVGVESTEPPFFNTPRKISDGPSSRSSVLSTTPAVAVQPPTPQSVPGFSPPTAWRGSTASRPQRTSSLVQDSTKAALAAMGVGPPITQTAAQKTGKSYARYPSRGAPAGGWASDSSDEERLSTSDEDDGESDDEVPLAQIKSRSQTDLTLPPAQQARASLEGGARPLRGGDDSHNLLRRSSGELEVLRDPHSPTMASFGQAQADAQAQLGVGPLRRRGSNRRSVSTLSFSTSMTASQAATAAVGTPTTWTAPPSPANRGILRPPYQPRSVSNPTTPTIPSFQPAMSASTSSTTTPALSPVPSPLFPSTEVRDRSSVSASSGSASTSSVPRTPKDSPATSNLGLGVMPQQAGSAVKQSVKFDLAAAQTDAAGWNRGRRLSAITNSSASAFGSGTSLAHRSTPSMPHLGGGYAVPPPRGGAQQQPVNSRASTLATRAGSTETSPAVLPHTRTSSNASLPGGASSSSSTAVDDSVYDRMKARHKAEALQALQIGHDLNHPSGLVPDREALAGQGEDDDEPLANLPTKGSALGGMSGSGSLMGGVHPQMAMGMGGAYSPLAVAPPGVDPYLYASLPPDQKMSLHQRAAQMMAMMQQAALQARAESVVAGSMLGGPGSDHGSSLRSNGGAMHGGGVGLGSLDAFGAGGLGAYGHAPSSSMHLPPFAPSFAMSQPFFHAPQYAPVPPPQAFYGMPTYAGSAIGFPTGPMSAYGAPASMIGASTAQGHRAGGPRAASSMGTGPRRP